MLRTAGCALVCSETRHFMNPGCTKLLSNLDIITNNVLEWNYRETKIELNRVLIWWSKFLVQRSGSKLISLVLTLKLIMN